MPKKHKRKHTVHHKKPAPDPPIERIVAEDGAMCRVRFAEHDAIDDAWRPRAQLDPALVAAFEAEERPVVHFAETVMLKRTNAAGNSIVEELGLNESAIVEELEAAKDGATV